MQELPTRRSGGQIAAPKFDCRGPVVDLKLCTRPERGFSLPASATYVAWLTPIPWVPHPMFQFDDNPEFNKLLAGRCDIDLVQFMLELAADAYPDLDRIGCMLEIDRLAVTCADQASARSHERERLMAISRLLYGVEGFYGNRDAYYEPQNSYLNEVLARRCGLPISLGILYMAVAARTGLKMFGVNTPGHFMVGCCSGGEPLFVDPFTNGDVLDRAACKGRIEATMNQKDAVADEHFRAAAPIDIAARVLRNLKAAHALENRWPAVLRIQQRLAALLPQVPQERRDLGLVYLRIGQPHKALPALEQFLTVCGQDQAEALAPSIQAARRMVAELN
jgi:regulator of sirC expression with transglutaminase-like and TPR domain